MKTSDRKVIATSKPAHADLEAARRAADAPESDQPPPVERGYKLRTATLALLAVLAVVFALQSAQSFFIPLVFGILITYTLNPLVDSLERLHLPRPAGALLVVLAVLGATGLAANSLRTEFQSILVRLPDAAHQLSEALTKTDDGQPSTVQQMQAAANEIEKATAPPAAPQPNAKQGAAPVVVERPASKLHDWLWAGSMSAAGLVGEITMVSFLVFFLLSSGDSFKRKLVKIAGPSLSTKKTTVHILDDINRSIQNYMLMLLCLNTLLGLLMWALLRWIGVENAGAWAVTAGCLLIIPYFGPLMTAVALGLTAFMQFGTVAKMVLVAGSSLAVATVVGMLMTTWMTGRIVRMNPAAVFIGLLFWGWLWGAWGLLLGIPVIVMLRTVSEHVDRLQPMAELLGE